MKTNLGTKFVVVAFFLCAALLASAQRSALQIDPAKSTLKFTLDASLHTVHGSFQLKPAALQFDPVSGQISGEILVDAKSGQTGNGMRDRKMNRDVLESESYPEISFRPDHIDGLVKSFGTSSVSVRGMFNLHGVERQITVPAQLDMENGTWSAAVHFTVPYQKWGLRNPSTLFLRVSDSVQIDLVAAGSVAQDGSKASGR
ncbi:MAG TPA: YceI family protein [Verrucomicrobiae bacterium]|jgi:polyisoprenoid-binding protein YceI|nr:YceI family protein [Verrucomicrobiae bacterium]